jgi:hypothetical protein
MTLQEVNAKDAFTPEEYIKWKKSRGDDYNGDIIKALVMGRSRAVIITFSDERYVGATVTIKNRKGESVFFNGLEALDGNEADSDEAVEKRKARVENPKGKNSKSIIYCATFFDVKNEFQASADVQNQMYQITVTVKREKFRAKRGDKFEVFAIPERMEEVKQDLKNLQQSVLKKSISPLRIVDNYTRADDVIVHVAKYIIPENRMLIIHREFGAHNSKIPLDEYVLQHEDSDWIQTIEVNSSLKGDQLSRVKDGWYELRFENLPSSGKFSLYSTPIDGYASPIVLFKNIDYAELTTNAELEQAEIDPPEEDENMSDQPSASQLRDEGLEALFG